MLTLEAPADAVEEISIPCVECGEDIGTSPVATGYGVMCASCGAEAHSCGMIHRYPGEAEDCEEFNA